MADILSLSGHVARLIGATGLPVVVDGDAFSAAETADPGGLLPVLLLDADRVWREATGNPLWVAVEPDDGAVLGLRVPRPPRAPACVVLISVAQVLAEAARLAPASAPAIRLDAVVERWLAAIGAAPERGADAAPEAPRAARDADAANDI